MRFSTLHKAIAYLIAGLGLFALSLGLDLGLGTLAWILVGYVASWFAEEPLLSKPSYAKLWTRATLVLFVVQIVRGAVLGGAILPLGVEYAAFLQLSRLAYRKSAREYQQVAILAFLHLIAATVLTTGVDYALVFFGFVIVTPWMLALTHLRTEIESNYGGEDPERAVADVQRVLRSRRVAGPGFLFGTAFLAVPLFAVTAMFFLLFPRVGMGFLSFGPTGGRAVAGFGRNVELGRFGVIRDDPTVVLRVTVPDVGDPPPAELGLRLRGTSFDHYEAGSWTRSAGGGRPVRPHFGFYDVNGWPRSAADRQLTIILDPIDEPVIFLPEGTVGLTIPPRVQGGREMEREVVRSHGTDLRYGDLDGIELIYVAHVSSAAPSAPVEEIDAETVARNLQLPAGQERIAALAAERTGGAVTDHDRARLLTRWLRGSGDYEYSLVQPDTTDQDPLHVFLFEARSGHCEYFSTALAVMLRTQGIPARNVTGFVGGTYNGYGDYYAVRQGDAHSWVEAYVDGAWVTFDPTPAARDTVGPADGPLAALSQLLDAVRVRWSQHVVGYDLRRQAAAIRALLDWLAEQRAESAVEEVLAEESDATAAASEPTGDLPWGLVGAALLALLAVYLVYRFVRRRRKQDPTERARDRDALHLYLSLERALAKAGRARQAHETPLAHAEELVAEDFPGAAVAAEITQAYVACRFGARPIPPTELSRLRGRIRDVGRPSPPPSTSSRS